jgi:prepilin signal peptidase PulO-like enzyme (type II secretory pathway)
MGSIGPAVPLELALGAITGLVAGEAARGVAGRRSWSDLPDVQSLAVAFAGGVTLVIWPPARPDLPTVLLRAGLLLVLALVIASDLRERAVYPAIVYPATVCLTALAPMYGASYLEACVGAAVSGVVFALLYLLARARYGVGAFGAGDVSVAVLLGAVVGISRLPLALLLVGVFGAALASIAAVRSRSARAHFAYAPALALAALTTLFLYASQPPLYT